MLLVASWRSGYAEDCKSLHPGSIPGEASTEPLNAPHHFAGVETENLPGPEPGRFFYGLNSAAHMLFSRLFLAKRHVYLTRVPARQAADAGGDT